LLNEIKSLTRFTGAVASSELVLYCQGSSDDCRTKLETAKVVGGWRLAVGGWRLVDRKQSGRKKEIAVSTLQRWETGTAKHRGWKSRQRIIGDAELRGHIHSQRETVGRDGGGCDWLAAREAKKGACGMWHMECLTVCVQLTIRSDTVAVR
jgi:hypothetical protein